MDEATFTAIYEKTYWRVYAYCCSRVNPDAEAAEDCTAETFERAYTHLDQLKSDDGVHSWLFTIARNVINSHYRRRRNERQLDAAAEVADTDREHDPEAMAVRHEDLADLKKLMKKLSPREREIVYLKAIVGMSNEEVAWAFKCSQVNVRVTNYRAFKRLQGAVAS